MLTIEQLLESVTEAIRQRRRQGPFPNCFELSGIVWNVEFNRIEMDLLENGAIRKFDLYLDEVQEHGDTWVEPEDEEVDPQLKKEQVIKLTEQIISGEIDGEYSFTD